MSKEGPKADAGGNANEKSIMEQHKKGGRGAWVKNVLENPFSVEWYDILSCISHSRPAVAPNINEELMRALQYVMMMMKSRFRTLKQYGRVRKDKDKPDIKNHGVSSCLVTGSNAVCRAIEHGTVAVVIVCRNTSPYILIHHYPIMCKNKNIPLVPMACTPTDLGVILGVKNCTVVGLRRTDDGDDMINKAIDELTKHAPIWNIPWLPEHSRKREPPDSTVYEQPRVVKREQQRQEKRKK